MSASTLGPARSFQIFGWVLAEHSRRELGIDSVRASIRRCIRVPLAIPSRNWWATGACGFISTRTSRARSPAISGDRLLLFGLGPETLDRTPCSASRQIGFAVMTRSKSSLALLPIALAIGAIYRIAWHRKLDRMILSVLLALLVVRCGSRVFCLLMDRAPLRGCSPIRRSSPDALRSGRAELAFIGDHPWLGARSFGSFADTGSQSLAARLCRW